MSKFIARTFTDSVEFDKFVQSLDANTTEIISISKFNEYSDINRLSNHYSIVARIGDSSEEYE